MEPIELALDELALVGGGTAEETNPFIMGEKVPPGNSINPTVVNEF